MAEPARSTLADFHTAHGTPMGEYHGALVPLRFSDPVAEHAAVRRAAGVFDFTFRAKFAMKGDDRSKFLHRVVSNDIKKLAPGQGTYATLLNAQGHILADFRVYCAENCLLISTDADLRDKTMLALRRYIIADRVQIEPLDTVAVAIQGPRSRAVLEMFLQTTLALNQEYDHQTTKYAAIPARVVRASSTGEEGYELWVERSDSVEIWKALGGGSPAPGDPPPERVYCGTTALETLRIEAGIPRYGPDMGEDTIPLEAGLLGALSFSKGCYIGQEIVERARSRGHVNWKLMGVIVNAPVAPTPGENLVAEGKTVGEITSACVSPTLAKTIALAYVRREVSEPGTKLALASGASAEVASLPFYSSPRL
jgi:glycine cleavage system T protein